MIKVMVVDDHVLIRRGIVMLLEGYADIEIVGEASNGDEAIVTAVNQQPDVILMDISMPDGLDGFTAAEEILKQTENTKVVLLSMHDEEVYIQKAIQLDVGGYILKKSQGGELHEAIQTVHNGGRYYKVGIPEDQLEKLSQHRGKESSILSTREKEIVRLTILGYSNKQISERLYISPKTVENHKANIMQKLGLKNKSEMIQYGINNSYLDLKLNNH
ncbi:response regulator [Pontibacillus yanchengensis]|uniref:Response regulator n=1 Tax=Pontibacillus yanchengensis TaxID=462910 RepID=A0A6I5A5Z3_9BACI|nr:response regulator transcription factor [Pontibacillus yanchengensis]MYL35780.1 response regulator [Pontibacillus yanchengensis]